MYIFFILALIYKSQISPQDDIVLLSKTTAILGAIWKLRSELPRCRNDNVSVWILKTPEESLVQRRIFCPFVLVFSQCVS